MPSTRETARRAISQIAKLHSKMAELANDIHGGGRSAAKVYVAEDNQPYDTTSKRLLERYWADVLFLWDVLEDCGIKGPTINQALCQLEELFGIDQNFDRSVFDEYYRRSSVPLAPSQPDSDKRLALVKQELGSLRSSLRYILKEEIKREPARRISRCFGTIYFHATPQQMVVYCLLDIAVAVMELERYGIQSNAFTEAAEECKSHMGAFPQFDRLFPIEGLTRRNEGV